MKAWRLDAVNVNARRLAGSKEPSARVQKAQRMAIAKLSTNGSIWLLDGLLIRGGFLDPLPAVERINRGPYAPSPVTWWHKAMNKVKALFR